MQPCMGPTRHPVVQVGGLKRGEASVRCMLQGYEDLVAARLGDSPDVASFFLELRALLERLLRFRCCPCAHSLHRRKESIQE